MAKRKKQTSRRRTSRRSGVGSLNLGSSMQDILGLAVGVAAAGYANKLLLSNQSNMIQTIAPLGAGILLPTIVKSQMGKSIGYGMIAVGVNRLLSNAGLAGMAGETDSDTFVISGDDLSVVAGDDDFAMAGDDDFAMAGDDDFAMAGQLDATA
jgi:hypothetical protein